MSRINSKSIVLTLLVLGAGVFVVTVSLASTLVTAAYDFRNQDQISGPAIGETIDLRLFHSQKGRTLAEAIKGHSLAMIVLVDPNCKTCTAAKDSLRSLRDQVEKSGITYYVLMLPADSDAEKYFAFADSLNLSAESFIWSTTDVAPPASLATLTMPSHILVTNEGLVVDKWPGINKSAGINQIASDAVAHLRNRRANRTP